MEEGFVGRGNTFSLDLLIELEQRKYESFSFRVTLLVP